MIPDVDGLRNTNQGGNTEITTSATREQQQQKSTQQKPFIVADPTLVNEEPSSERSFLLFSTQGKRFLSQCHKK